jgi:hypothetical protein
MNDRALPPDHCQRDDAIAVNSYTTVVGRAAVPEERFRSYWRDVHGPLCSRVPGLDWYVQHHFARRQDDHLWPLPDGVGAVPGYALDGAVEIGWATGARQEEFQAASSILFSDEQNVFEETAAYAMPTGSTTIVDRVPDPSPNGGYAADRLHVHFTPRPGRAADLAGLLVGDLANVALESFDLLKLRVHAPEPHDNSTPSPPAPRVQHTVSDERVELVIAELAFTGPLARRRFFDTEAFRATMERQAELAAFITVFPVSGVYTFVRDGELTNAGLRGSRVAELISDLAASNQVGPDVRHLMHTGRPRESSR